MITNRTSSLLPSCTDQKSVWGKLRMKKAEFGDRINMEVRFTPTTSGSSSMSKEFDLAVEISMTPVHTTAAPHGRRSQEQLSMPQISVYLHDTRLPIYHTRCRNRYMTRASPVLQDVGGFAICPELD